MGGISSLEAEFFILQETSDFALRLMEFRSIHIIKGHLFNLKSTLNDYHMCKIPSYQHIDECLTEQLDIT